MSDATIVGSAAFELRASRDKIPQDLEDAQRVILESAKKTESALSEIVGSGTAKGAKKAAEALKEPQAAGIAAGDAIRESMRKAGEEIGEAVAKGSAKAREELEKVAAKAREVQQIKLPTPTVPTEATHTLVTNPINGIQSWAPKEMRELETAKTAKLDEGVKRSAAELADLKQKLEDIKPAAENGAGGLGQLNIKTLLTSVSIAALVTGAVFVVKAIYDMGRAAFKAAADIGDSASRIGIGVEALQEFRYVASQTGESVQAVDAALESFGKKFSMAASGLSKEAGDAFKALGFSQDDLRKFKNTEDALNAVIDRIGELKSATDRAAIADKLGLGPLVSGLKSGSDEVERLRDEARALGFVIDSSLIEKGAQANQKLDDMSRLIGIELTSAFVSLSDEVIAFTGSIAAALNGLNSFLGKFGEYKQRVSAMYGDEFTSAMMRGDINAAGWAALHAVKSGQTTAVAAAYRNPTYEDADDPAFVNQQMGSRGRTRLEPSGRSQLTPVQPRGRTDNSAQRAAEREARRLERVQDEIYRARQRALQIEEKDLLTVQQRYDLNQRQNVLEREGEDAKLKSRLTRKDLTTAEFNQLTLQNTQNRALEDRIAKDLLGRDLQDERLANEKALTDLTAQLLSLQSGAARTAGERKAIEHRLLAISQNDASNALEARLRDTPGLSDAAKNEQRAALALVHKAQSDAVDRSNLTPLEAWRDAALKNALEVRQAYESVAANGLDALNSGIVDAIMNTRSLGDVFSNVAKQIIADLASIEIRRSITEPLSRILFGGGSSPLGDAKAAARAAKGLGGESGGWLSKIFGAGKSFFGFSSGGYTGDGSKYDPAGLVHKGEYVLPQETVSRIGVSRLDALRAGAFPGFADGGLVGMPAMPSMSVGGLGAGNLARPQKLFVQIDFNDPMFRARVRNEAMPLVAQGAAATYEATKADTMETLASQQTYTRR